MPWQVKHGMTDTRIFRIWTQVLNRCFNSRDKGYKNYGGRGITVCERWLEFVNFYEDMGDAPEGMSIDRIDNDGDYEPNNCRWATPRQQASNRRNSVLITFDGRTQCLSAWAREKGMSHEALNRRLEWGWTVEAALTKPIHHRPNYRGGK